MRRPPQLHTVSLEEYDLYCGPGNWNVNSVQTQINCIHLEGRVLSSEGTVERVRISKVINSMADSLNFLPTSLHRSLTCILGKMEPKCGNLKDASTCVYNGCHFHSSLQYNFEVQLRLQTSEDHFIPAMMVVGDTYRDTVLKLREDSILKFNATFVDGMGTKELTLRVQHMSVDGVPDKHFLEEKKKEMMEHYLNRFFSALIKECVQDVFVGLFYDV